MQVSMVVAGRAPADNLSPRPAHLPPLHPLHHRVRRQELEVRPQRHLREGEEEVEQGFDGNCLSFVLSSGVYRLSFLSSGSRVYSVLVFILCLLFLAMSSGVYIVCLMSLGMGSGVYSMSFVFRNGSW